eukprot:scaffold3005_cov302-Prasinococcus_capsulatus_cf.AAC.3
MATAPSRARTLSPPASVCALPAARALLGGGAGGPAGRGVLGGAGEPGQHVLHGEHRAVPGGRAGALRRAWDLRRVLVLGGRPHGPQAERRHARPDAGDAAQPRQVRGALPHARQHARALPAVRRAGRERRAHAAGRRGVLDPPPADLRRRPPLALQPVSPPASSRAACCLSRTGAARTLTARAAATRPALVHKASEAVFSVRPGLA